MTDWSEKELGEILTLNYGWSLPEKKRVPGAVPVYGSNGIVGRHNEPLVDSPGLIVGRKGSAGNVHFSPVPFCPIDTTFYVAPDETTLDLEFLYYLLLHLDLKRILGDVGVPGLNREMAYKEKARLPDAKEEQRKIAAVLGLVQQAIEQQERLIALTTELKKTLLHKLFTEGLRGEPQKQTEIGPVPESWEIRKLGDVFDCLDGRRVPVKQADRTPGPYPYYWASGVVDYVSDFIFEGAYLLVAEDGENLESRKLPIAFIAEGKFWVNNHAHVLKNRSGSMKFFEQFVSHMNIKDYLSGTTRPKLNKALMMSIRLPFPKEDEQTEIADILEGIDRKRSSNERRVVALRDLFHTLLHQLMTAQIRVHDLDLEGILPQPAAEFGCGTFQALR